MQLISLTRRIEMSFFLGVKKSKGNISLESRIGNVYKTTGIKEKARRSIGSIFHYQKNGVAMRSGSILTFCLMSFLLA